MRFSLIILVETFFAGMEKWIFEGLDLISTDNDGVKIFERLSSSNESISGIFGQVEGPYVDGLVVEVKVDL